MSGFTAMPWCDCEECNDARRRKGQPSFHCEPVEGGIKLEDEPFFPASDSCSDDDDPWDKPLRPRPQSRVPFKRDAYAYGQRLERRGFKMLGSGYYSMVYGKPGADYVIKVCGSATSDAWPDYARWCYENPGPFRPVVRSLKWHSGFYVAVVERLAATVLEAQKDERFPLAPVHYAIIERSKELTSQVKRFSKVGMQDVANFLTKLNQAFPNASGDLHTGNWMYRADGALILSDPFSCGNSTPYRIKGDMTGYQYRLALTSDSPPRTTTGTVAQMLAALNN